MLLLLALIAVLILLYIAALIVANRYRQPAAREAALLLNQSARPVAATDSLTIATWNIGYAGMGQASDFVFDLGEQRRPLSAEVVDQNLSAIAEQLPRLDVDVLLLQEVAQPSWITYQRDVLAVVVNALPDYGSMFGADIHTKLMPRRFSMRIGNAIFSRYQVASAERRGLPLEPDFQLGIFRKAYRAHIARFVDATGNSWVIVNIHLSAFDDAVVDIRRQQVQVVLDFAEAEYAQGNHVVIGGDWNLRLTDREFAHTTDTKYQFWIRDFPTVLIPEGWQWAVDESTPTVRTAHQPYVAGDNYVLTIDGFLVSPNVSVSSVKAIDLTFKHTDHHPVVATFAATPS